MLLGSTVQSLSVAPGVIDGNPLAVVCTAHHMLRWTPEELPLGAIHSGSGLLNRNKDNNLRISSGTPETTPSSRRTRMLHN
jgi:hypothetical protein